MMGTKGQLGLKITKLRGKCEEFNQLANGTENEGLGVLANEIEDLVQEICCEILDLDSQAEMKKTLSQTYLIVKMAKTLTSFAQILSDFMG